MSEKATRLVFGAFEDECQGAPPMLDVYDRMSWHDWLVGLPGLFRCSTRAGDYGPVPRIYGRRLGSSYESHRPWFGFEVETLVYRDALALADMQFGRGYRRDLKDATDAWYKLRQRVKQEGVYVPPGYLILAVDE